jgi:Na+-translocating ferredoxin:NAD+ oxidoreductase RnfD subunit
VMIALVPAMAAAVWFFRLQAVWVTATCVISCVVSEWVCTLIRKKPNTVGDLSAVLTGVVLAFSLPRCCSADWAVMSLTRRWRRGPFWPLRLGC